MFTRRSPNVSRPNFCQMFGGEPDLKMYAKNFCVPSPKTGPKHCLFPCSLMTTYKREYFRNKTSYETKGKIWTKIWPSLTYKRPRSPVRNHCHGTACSRCYRRMQVNQTFSHVRKWTIFEKWMCKIWGFVPEYLGPETAYFRVVYETSQLQRGYLWIEIRYRQTEKNCERLLYSPKSSWISILLPPNL